jgi:uncharacterized protein YdeI (YjbR/CyaY-like superfamily)
VARQREPTPIFFDSPEAFYAWLEENHDKETEVWVGYWKKRTGKPTLTWSQAVDQALCFGWIDGVLKSIDEQSHRQRFTPRQLTSNWSTINVEKVARLTAEGKMSPAGLAAFERRAGTEGGAYSFERREDAAFEPDQEHRFQANKKAWTFWEAQPPSYRRAATHWVTSAKRPDTQGKRLNELIDDAAACQTAPPSRGRLEEGVEVGARRGPAEGLSLWREPNEPQRACCAAAVTPRRRAPVAAGTSGASSGGCHKPPSRTSADGQ